MIAFIKKLVPPPFRSLLRKVLNLPKLYGSRRYCPVCTRSSQSFISSGIVPRADACCLWCGALERHRLFWLYLERMTPTAGPKTGAKFLHIAPEGALRGRLKKMYGAGYITADLFADDVDVKMDITKIQYPADSFDYIYCSHVLEHVADDRLAMREFRRVLKPGGIAILLVPINAEKTFEDPTVTDPRERLRLFGQEDHVRRYGPDYLQRLQLEGFRATKTSPAQFLTAAEIERMGITEAAGDIFDCRKDAIDATGRGRPSGDAGNAHA